jgi:hypothetical protein
MIYVMNRESKVVGKPGNEPRHFFLWLAILAFSGLAVIAIAVHSGVAVGTPPLLFIAVLALLVVFLVIGAGGLLAAWTSPGRRLLSRLRQRPILWLAGALTLIALFYAVENWRGWRAWNIFKEKREAQGERFDLARLVPSPVPEEQNFFESPLWNDMHFFVKTNESGFTEHVWRDTNFTQHSILFDPAGPNRHVNRDFSKWRSAESVDLAEWQSFYRGNNNAFPAGNGSAMNYFPIANEPQTPAQDVLLALSRFDEERAILIETASRPKARFWVNYDAGFAAALPHLARLKLSAFYLSLHSEAARAAGDRQTAIEDIRLMLRLIESVRTEPIGVTHSVRVLMLEACLQPIWQGLANQQWTEAELKTFEAELRKLDFLADAQVAIRGERAFQLWLVDYIRNAPMQRVDEVLSVTTPYGGSRADDWEREFAITAMKLGPRGWFYRNKLSFCRTLERLPLVDQRNRVIPPSVSKNAELAIRRQPVRPYNLLVPHLSVPWGLLAEKFARGQTDADLALLACALERYRLKAGRFPETLEALVPEFTPKLPHDIINGRPLNYHRTDGGKFILYSVGWNGTDDGGRVFRNEHGNIDPRQGDWIWRYPETPPATGKS